MVVLASAGRLGLWKSVPPPLELLQEDKIDVKLLRKRVKSLKAMLYHSKKGSDQSDQLVTNIQERLTESIKRARNEITEAQDISSQIKQREDDV